MTVAKGWDILEKMKIPENWTIVVNSSRNHSTGERIQLDSLGANNANRIINLDQDYLSEEDLFSTILCLRYSSAAIQNFFWVRRYVRRLWTWNSIHRF